jgi:homoserine O-acetyltransferase
MIGHRLSTGPFVFEGGDSLEYIDIVYHTSMPSYDGKRGVVWICHALTANSDCEDWWPEMVGSGKLIDTDKYFVACVNMLGSAYGSSGPRSINPETGKPYLLSFPQVTVRDMINASILVRKHLGVEKIDLLIGSSIGGFQSIEWAIMEPNVFRKALFIATEPRVTPWLTASIETQRMALRADPTFEACEDIHGGEKGLECARAQAMISYRCFQGYGLTQAEQDDDTLFADRAASYQRYQGQKIIRRGFDAYSYNSVSTSVISNNAGRGRGGLAKALARITADTTVVSIDTDGLFPPHHIEKWAALIPGVHYLEITSNFGHDGFLLETAQLTEIISKLLP